MSEKSKEKQLIGEYSRCPHCGKWGYALYEGEYNFYEWFPAHGWEPRGDGKYLYRCIYCNGIFRDSKPRPKMIAIKDRAGVVMTYHPATGWRFIEEKHKHAYQIVNAPTFEFWRVGEPGIKGGMKYMLFKVGERKICPDWTPPKNDAGGIAVNYTVDPEEREIRIYCQPGYGYAGLICRGYTPVEVLKELGIDED